MTPSDAIVFLVDGDNTLLDDDRIQDDLRRRLQRFRVDLKVLQKAG